MTDSSEQLYEQLEEFLVRLLTVSETEAIDAFIDEDLPFSQIRMLCSLAMCGDPIPIKTLAGQLNLSVAATGRNVDQLVGQGLAVRREDDQDRRVRLVALSDTGWSIVGKHMDAKRDALKGFTARLPETDRRRLSECLTSILAGDALRPSSYV